MATITSAQAGRWDQPTTWAGGVVPTASDYVQVYHTVTIYGECKAHVLYIYPGGGLITSTDLGHIDSLEIAHLFYKRTMTPAPFRLDGVKISRHNGERYACIGSLGDESDDGFPGTSVLEIDEEGGYKTHTIIDDGGIFNASATLQDIKPEGSARAYARKVANAVRYLTVTVRILRDFKSNALTTLNTEAFIRRIYLWAEMPFQVVAITDSCAIKGYIESVVYDKASVGTAYHVFQITIAEGQQ